MNRSQRTGLQEPLDDRPVTDVHTGIYAYAAIMVAHRLKLFPLLASGPQTIPDICAALGIRPRPAQAILAAASAHGLVRSGQGSYWLAPVGEKYLLETSPGYAETGWGLLRLQGAATATIGDLQGRTVGVFAPPSGLERNPLSTLLRAAQTRVTIVATAEALVAGLREKRFEAGVTEKLNADRIASREGFAVDWFPGGLPHYPVAFGLWRGDLTLKRAIADALERRTRDGTVGGILGRYLGRS